MKTHDKFSPLNPDPHGNETPLERSNQDKAQKALDDYFSQHSQPVAPSPAPNTNSAPSVPSTHAMPGLSHIAVEPKGPRWSGRDSIVAGGVLLVVIAVVAYLVYRHSKKAPAVPAPQNPPAPPAK